MKTPSAASPAVVAIFVLLVSSCSSSTADDWGWGEPIPIAELTEQSESASPAEWGANVPEGWPHNVPAPAFLDNPGSTFRPWPEGGTRSLTLETISRPDEDAVASYIALLFDVGFSHDQRAVASGWFVRDDSEWVALQNRGHSDGYPLMTFAVQWTTDPVQLGYCAAVEAGAISCRE